MPPLNVLPRTNGIDIKAQLANRFFYLALTLIPEPWSFVDRRLDPRGTESQAD
jgi:hypothetical protein